MAVRSRQARAGLRLVKKFEVGPVPGTVLAKGNQLPPYSPGASAFCVAGFWVVASGFASEHSFCWFTGRTFPLFDRPPKLGIFNHCFAASFPVCRIVPSTLGACIPDNEDVASEQNRQN
jgi:hypothetical protein